MVPTVLSKELAVAGRVAEARNVFATYEQNAVTSPLLAITGDPTRFAFEKLIQGIVAEASDDRTLAHHAYRDSFVTNGSVTSVELFMPR